VFRISGGNPEKRWGLLFKALCNCFSMMDFLFFFWEWRLVYLLRDYGWLCFFPWSRSLAILYCLEARASLSLLSSLLGSFAYTVMAGNEFLVNIKSSWNDCWSLAYDGLNYDRIVLSRLDPLLCPRMFWWLAFVALKSLYSVAFVKLNPSGNDPVGLCFIFYLIFEGNPLWAAVGFAKIYSLSSS